MNQREKELVVLDEMSYNLCEGGKGGFSYINRSGLNNAGRTEKSWIGRQGRKNPTLSERNRKRHELGLHNYATRGMLGKQHTIETKQKMSMVKQGCKNNQYGTIWITDGILNKKIKKEDIIPTGWKKGRKI